MKITPTRLKEVMLIEPDVYRDERGFFLESFNQKRYAEHGLDLCFVQDNHSRSRQGVLRGLHFQIDTPQGKLVRVGRGAVFDVAVDVRRGSPHFGEWVGMELSDDNQRQLYIPPGFAHGFYVLSEYADFLYQCTGPYDRDDEQGLAWNDPDVGIAWPQASVLTSERDTQNPRLTELHRLPQFPEQE